jgi:hypothetical protein
MARASQVGHLDSEHWHLKRKSETIKDRSRARER